jgi:hypothetical protein
MLMLAAAKRKTSMYKIHLRNHAPPQPIEIAGKLIQTLIVPETPPVQVVETIEEAQNAMRELLAQGILAGDLYAVGYESPVAGSNPIS